MGFMSLISIINKNLKIFSRSKISALAIIVAPVLIILFAGFIFNSFTLSGVIIGAYSDNYTTLSEKIMGGFEEQNFIINKFSSQQECIDSVKLSKTQICVIFPDDLSTTGSLKDVLFYADHSRLNLAYNLINDIEGQISSEASSLGVVLAQDLIDSLQSAKNSLPNQRIKISDSMTKLDNINQLTSNDSVLDIDQAIDYLNEAKDLSEDSDVKEEIANAIEVLESLNESSSQILDNFNEIEVQSKDANALLGQVSLDLNQLINSINGISVLEAEKIVSPINIKIESVSVDSTNRDYLFPTLLSLIALFGGVLLSSTFILKEKKTKAYFRNFITPTGDFTFIFGTYLTCLIILFLQFLLVFIGIQWILKIPLLSSLLEVSLILFFTLNVFIFLGMIIGYLFKSEETIVFASMLIASALMFFSNALLPLESISGGFKQFAGFNPLVISEMALKKILLFNFSYASILQELYILGGFFLVFVVLAYVGRKIIKRRL